MPDFAPDLIISYMIISCNLDRDTVVANRAALPLVEELSVCLPACLPVGLSACLSDIATANALKSMLLHFSRGRIRKLSAVVSTVGYALRCYAQMRIVVKKFHIFFRLVMTSSHHERKAQQIMNIRLRRMKV